MQNIIFGDSFFDKYVYYRYFWGIIKNIYKIWSSSAGAQKNPLSLC